MSIENTKLFEHVITDALKAIAERGMEPEICLCEVDNPAKARNFMEAYRRIFPKRHLFIVFPETLKFSCEIWIS